MLRYLEHTIGRLNAQPLPLPGSCAGHLAVAIRRAQDSDMPLLQDLAELDSARPLQGPVLVAVVEGHIWAAVALADERVVADPFLPTAPAVELLRLRVQQLRAADGRPVRRLLPRRAPGRARA